MKIYCITRPSTSFIIPVQEYLMKKYTGYTPAFLNKGETHPDQWCKSVLDQIHKNIKEKYFILGLDDHLPTSRMDMLRMVNAAYIIRNNDIERFELGYGASNKEGFIETNIPYVVVYGSKTPYSVSTQFSIWKKDAIIRALEEVDGSPWDFETKGRCKAACFLNGHHAFEWIEEGAISRKKEGKINLNGLPKEDEEYLVEKGFINKEDIIYSWK